MTVELFQKVLTKIQNLRPNNWKFFMITSDLHVRFQKVSELLFKKTIVSQ